MLKVIGKPGATTVKSDHCALCGVHQESKEVVHEEGGAGKGRTQGRKEVRRLLWVPAQEHPASRLMPQQCQRHQGFRQQRLHAAQRSLDQEPSPSWMSEGAGATKQA